jgi:RNA polymerase sigma factor (sigma-70 family)
MGDQRVETALRDIDALFRLGVVSGLSDGQLLGRFTAQSGPDSELAFEAIVRRHGPMVLGVCRRVLGDEHAAEDSFQATFMVLALKSRTIRKLESLGPWLHGVAVRIARRARALRRRNKNESIPADGPAAPEGHEAASVDLRAVLDEELSRLPEKYRMPVVLCYLEGQTQDQAAQTLGWTKGTVSGRLARAKDLLRLRLTRRGLAPTAGLLAAALAPEGATAAVPAALVLPTVRVATAAILGGAETGVVTGQAVFLARQAMKVMMVGRYARGAAQVFFVTLGAAALAAPLTRPGELARLRNLVGGPAIAPAPVADQRRVDLPAGRLDRSGDPLPSGALVRLGTTLRRHATALAGLDFTRGGTAAVTAQDNGLVHFWDAASGRELRTLDMTERATVEDKLLRAFALSPDGRLMAGAGFAFEPARQRVVGRVWIRDVRQDRPVREIEVTAVDLASLAFSPDGGTLATGGFAGVVELWDIASGERLATRKLGSAPVRSIAFAPDGNVLGVNEERKGTRLWDLAQGSETFLANPLAGPTAPVFSPDRRLMAINSVDGEAVLWDRAGAQKHLAARGTAVAFAPDSRSLALVGADVGTLAVIDVETGSERWQARLGWGPAGHFAFSPDGQTIAAGQGGVLRLFAAATGHERLVSPEAHEGGVSIVRYLPGGRTLLSAGDDGTVRVWDAASGRQQRVIQEACPVNVLAISPDGNTLATALPSPVEGVSLWDLTTGLKRQDWPEHGSVVGAVALAFSPDGTGLYVFDRDQVLRIFDVATGRERDLDQPLFSLGDDGGSGSSITRAEFSTGSEFLSIGIDRTVIVAERSTGTERFSGPGVTSAFTPDGRGIAVATPGPPEMTRLADGSYRTFSQLVESVDLVNLATATRQRVWTLGDSVAAIAFSADGKLMAVAGGWAKPIIRLYRTDDGRDVGQFHCPARISRAGALAFSPDGRGLAAGLDDTTVIIWDLADVRQGVK